MHTFWFYNLTFKIQIFTFVYFRSAFGNLMSNSNTSLSGLGNTNSLGRSLRNDLLVAADSVTNAMSTLVRELNSEGSEEEPDIRRPLELGDEWTAVPSYYD